MREPGHFALGDNPPRVARCDDLPITCVEKNGV